MSLSSKISERLFGKVHYTSGKAVTYELHGGTVRHHIEVRVQGDDGLVYFRASAGDGWMPLMPAMARSFATCLTEAADRADPIVPRSATPKATT